MLLKHGLTTLPKPHLPVYKPKKVSLCPLMKPLWRTNKKPLLPGNYSNQPRSEVVVRMSPVDIDWYRLTDTDIFLNIAVHNLITMHIPCLIIYRTILQLPWGYVASLTLFMSCVKCVIQLST